MLCTHKVIGSKPVISTLKGCLFVCQTQFATNKNPFWICSTQKRLFLVCILYLIAYLRYFLLLLLLPFLARIKQLAFYTFANLRFSCPEKNQRERLVVFITIMLYYSTTLRNSSYSTRVVTEQVSLACFIKKVRLVSEKLPPISKIKVLETFSSSNLDFSQPPSPTTRLSTTTDAYYAFVLFSKEVTFGAVC